MILELDCGNSFIKWRVIDSLQSSVLGGGVVDSDEKLMASLALLAGLSLRHSRLVSVRTEDETLQLIALIQDRYGVATQRAQPARVLAGVSNGYEEFDRLGLDRWLAFVGGYRLAGGACLVIDLGTAVTSDFVSSSGEHLGGFICPGLTLMRNQLRTHTRRIRYGDEAAELAVREMLPGRSTVEAVERGCAFMLRGFVLTQVEQARSLLGDAFVVFLTGGDASLVRDVVPEARVAPDLVFVGLALACPLQ